ncbi:unnamed protein product [Hydatigera taeniaeformis]|uniref:Glyco_trans_2-like domain-containing protein n=1 Tax=Hydatigena taeniaeformis TaxID=6205 RepID=A0A0R3WT28_HYDTA|nr:unnamed protein product [Hydatigera taeniaeformis]
MVTKIGEISTAYRLPLRILVALLIVGSLVALWYYAFQTPFRKLVSSMVAFSAADIGGYEKGVALAFFGSIDSPEHKNCRLYRDRFPIKRDRDGVIDIAVTIAVYDDIRPVARIMRMIYRTNNYYCIHLNRDADHALQAAMKGLITCFDNNVELVPTNSSIALIRSGEGVLKAHLACAEQALRRNGKWKYLINIDDDEFPLRTNLETVSILQALNGANLVESFSTPSRDSLVGNKSLPLEVSRFVAYPAFHLADKLTIPIL